MNLLTRYCYEVFFYVTCKNKYNSVSIISATYLPFFFIDKTLQ